MWCVSLYELTVYSVLLWYIYIVIWLLIWWYLSRCIIIAQYYCMYLLYCALDLYSSFATHYKFIALNTITLNPPLPLIAIILLSGFYKFNFFLDFTCKWYHMVLVFVWLTTFAIMWSRSIHVVANERIYSFLMAE